jgi:hypothetical protein
MWTFTFAEDNLPVPIAKKIWSDFYRRLRNEKERAKIKHLTGLRVFQMHPGGHGLHIHLATGCYLYINLMRALWKKSGGGRIHVLPIAKDRVGYLAKYLGKHGRPLCLKGARLWAKFGTFNASRVKDIVIESDWTRTYHALVAVLGARFTSLPFYKRQWAVTNVQFGRQWCENFTSKDFPF